MCAVATVIALSPVVVTHDGTVVGEEAAAAMSGHSRSVGWWLAGMPLGTPDRARQEADHVVVHRARAVGVVG